VAVDADEGRRRRVENLVEIRKSRREESLLKKRREGLQGQQSHSAYNTNVDKRVRFLVIYINFPFCFFPCIAKGT
jgi:importin subunit alpha-6/7